jgi:hypothetical protein
MIKPGLFQDYIYTNYVKIEDTFLYYKIFLKQRIYKNLYILTIFSIGYINDDFFKSFLLLKI